jgi:group I intron endonuclease
MIIYKVTNLFNTKVYIGASTKSLKERQCSHLNEAFNVKKLSYIFYKALRKYGKENFKWEVIYETENKEELFNYEQDYIYLYKSNDRRFGYNMTVGGEGMVGLSKESILKRTVKNTGKKRSDKFKKVISEKNSGKIRSEIDKKKVSDGVKKYYETNTITIKQKKALSSTGKTPWNKGRKLSKEEKEKISRLTKGKKKGKMTEEHKNNLSKANLGKKKKKNGK